jgi:hypothetical protein
MSKVTKKSASAFMALVLEPLPKTDLTDKEMKRLEDRARRDAKRRAEDIWNQGLLRVREAECLYRAADYRRMIDNNVAIDHPQYREAEKRYYRELARQMALPSVLIRHIRWKEKNIKVGGREKEFSPLIEADKVRLGAD